MEILTGFYLCENGHVIQISAYQKQLDGVTVIKCPLCQGEAYFSKWEGQLENEEIKAKLKNAYQRIKENLPDPNRYDSDDYTPPEASEEDTDKWLDYIFTTILPNAAEMAVGIMEDELS